MPANRASSSSAVSHPTPRCRGVAAARAWVIAADSGLDHANALGLAVDLVLGDLDSVSKEALEPARRAGIPVEEHPAAKDADRPRARP